jgi:hypothetical protein
VRALVASAIVLLVLAGVPAASATFLPPAPVLFHGLRALHVREETHVTTSCAAKSRSHRSAVERKFAPVACEQPPRVRLFNPLHHAAAAVAAALAGP